MRRRHVSKRLACDWGRDNPEKQQHQHHPTFLAFPESQAPLADGWWVVVVVIAFGLNRFQPLTAVPARRSQYNRYVIRHSLQTERPARKSRDDEQTCFDCNTRRSKKENLLARLVSPACSTPTPTTALSPTSMTQAATSERRATTPTDPPGLPPPVSPNHDRIRRVGSTSEGREPRSSVLSVSSPSSHRHPRQCRLGFDAAAARPRERWCCR